MKNFLRLCWFEQKKLLQKTYVRVAFWIILASTLFLNCYPLVQKNKVAYVDEDGKGIVEEVSYYEEVQLERKFAEQFNGKLLTNEIAEQVREFDSTYRKYSEYGNNNQSYIPFINVRLPYRSILWLGANPDCSLENLADVAYQSMIESQKLQLKGLSEEKIAYWTQEMESMEMSLRCIMHGGIARFWIRRIGLMFWDFYL